MSAQTQEQTSPTPIQIDVIPEQEVDNWDYAVQFSHDVRGTGQTPSLPSTIKSPSFFGYVFIGVGTLFLVGAVVVSQIGGLDSILWQSIAYSLLCDVFGIKLIMRVAVFDSNQIHVRRGFQTAQYAYGDIVEVKWQFTGDKNDKPVVKGVILQFRDATSFTADFSPTLSSLIGYAMERAAQAGVDTSTWLPPTVRAAARQTPAAAPATPTNPA